MSTFGHACDRTVRIGDYVAVRPMSSHQQGNPFASFDMNTSSSSTGTRGGKKNTSASTALTDSQSLSRLIDSLHSARDTTTSGDTTTIVGTVEGIDMGARTATVSVWKEGSQLMGVGGRRPQKTVHLSQCKKMTKQDFHARCKRQYMADTQYQLRLRGEGYDESAPMALIAYNNRIISSLIDRIDTSAKVNKSGAKVQSLVPKGGPGALKKLPIPTLVPVEDPLIEVRDELRALAAGGLGMARKKAKLVGGRDPHSEKKEDEELRDVSRISQRVASPQFSPRTVTPASYSEQSIVVGSLRAQTELSRKLERSRTHLATNLRSSQPPPTLPVQTVKGGGAAKVTCVVMDVEPNGVLHLRPTKVSTDIALLKAVLANVELFSAENLPPGVDNGVKLLKSLTGHQLQVAQVGVDADNCVAIIDASVEESGESLQENLVAAGVARVSAPILDNAVSALGHDVASNLGPITNQTKADLQRLFAAQQHAISCRVGAWSVEASHYNFLPLDGDDKRLQLMMDSSVDEGGHMAPLFTALETTSAFRSKVAACAKTIARVKSVTLKT